MAKPFRGHEFDTFPHVATVRTSSGEEPHLLGSGLQVWQLLKAYRTLGEDVAQTAAHFELEPQLVPEAVRYALLHPDEMRRALAEQEEMAMRAAKGDLPGVELLKIASSDQ